MKKVTLLVILICLSTFLIAQNVEVQGKLKVSTLDPATTSSQQVAIEPDGTLSLMALSTPTYEIGDFVQGGVVFWVSASGDHAKVVNIYDIGAVEWSNISSLEIGASAQSDINGAGNTVAIMMQSGHTNSAAKHCADLGYGGYDDWYLPSLDELDAMYTNRVAINTTATANGGEIFALEFYWSSVELNSTKASVQGFSSGSQGSIDKTNNIKTRAIRAF